MDEAVKLFTHKLLEILNDMAPMRQFQIRKKYNAWLSDETKEMITLRNSLHKTAAESQLPEDWEIYKKVRNRLNNRLKFEEKQWQKCRLRKCKNDSKSTWKTAKSILN